MGGVAVERPSVNGVRQSMGKVIPKERIFFSFVNAHHLEYYHLIFVSVKTNTCMSPP